MLHLRPCITHGRIENHKVIYIDYICSKIVRENLMVESLLNESAVSEMKVFNSYPHGGGRQMIECRKIFSTQEDNFQHYIFKDVVLPDKIR